MNCYRLELTQTRGSMLYELLFITSLRVVVVVTLWSISNIMNNMYIYIYIYIYILCYYAICNL